MATTALRVLSRRSAAVSTRASLRWLTSTKPTIETARSMQRHYYEYPNDVLLMLSVNGDHCARTERLTREIMATDNVDWEQAQSKVAEISNATHKGIGLTVAPIRAVIYGAVVAGLASFPLCFHLDTAMWFNEHFVTADVAEPKDLETCLEVGSWTWNWMEPPLGQISFFLLCLQLSRDQSKNIGKKSIIETLKLGRATTVADKFPTYNRKIVLDFAETEFNNLR